MFEPGHSGRSAAKSSVLAVLAAAVRAVEHLAAVDLRALVRHEDVDVLDVLLVRDRALQLVRLGRSSRALFVASVIVGGVEFQHGMNEPRARAARADAPRSG